MKLRGKLLNYADLEIEMDLTHISKPNKLVCNSFHCTVLQAFVLASWKYRAKTFATNMLCSG